MARQQGGKKKNDKDPLCEDKDIEVVQRNSVFGRFSDAEMLAQLKVIAMVPCKPEFSKDKIQPLWNQILRAREMMTLNDSEIPSRKRKLQQFVKDKLRTPGIVVPNQNGKKLRGQLSNASSISFLLKSVHSTETLNGKILCESRSSGSSMTFEGTFPEKQPSLGLSLLDDVIDWNPPSKDLRTVVDSNESVDVSNPLGTRSQAMLLNNYNAISNSTTLGTPNRRHLQPPRQSITLPSFIDDHLQRKVVPVGPRFQADVPEWNGLVNKNVLMGEYNNDFENSRWVGSRVWPIEVGIVKSRGVTVGKGRPNSCCCLSPGSVDCIRRHILEERLLLQCDLGPAFFSWKFDEMGEQVSKSWTAKEQHTFESLVKKKPLSNGNDYLKQASKCFPKKCGKIIISYYFNVYNLQRMSMLTRSSQKQVDSEDDDEDLNYMDSQKRSEGRRATISNSKDVKARYLRVAS